jgi:hypothetical protein
MEVRGMTTYTDVRDAFAESGPRALNDVVCGLVQELSQRLSGEYRAGAEQRLKSQEELRDRWMNRCAWCGKRIQEDVPHPGISAQSRPEVDLGAEGLFVEMILELADKKTYAVRTTPDLPAGREALELVFSHCSQECTRECLGAVEQELALLGRPGGKTDDKLRRL